jgi:hypothetical protein
MALESSLWTWLAKARVALGDALHMERVENLLGAGTPDVEGFVSFEPLPYPNERLPFRGQFHLELKSSERPVRPMTPVRFKLRNREKQIAFMRRRWELGGNAFFLLQVGSASERFLYLAPGDLGARLQAGITESDLALACLKTGVWSGRRDLSQVDILKRSIQCRVRQSLFPNSQSPNS